MVAVRPTFHNPALLAKQAANIDHIGGGGGCRSTSSRRGGRTRRSKYGVHFEQHDDRYARTAEWLDVVDGMWTRDRVLASRASTTASRTPCSAEAGAAAAARRSTPAASRRRQGPDRREVRRLRHARRPARADRARRSTTWRARREQLGLPPMIYGVAGYAIVRDTEARSEGASSARITDVRQSAAGLRQLPAVARRHAARTAGVAGGLLGLEPRPARRAWSARRSRSPSAGRGVRSRPASTCCCCSAARSSRRWSGSRSR